MTSENKRQTVHIFLLVFAFLLKYLERWQTAMLLGVMLAFVLFVIPKVKSARFHFYRPLEKKYSQGAVMYFLVLLILTLVFPPYVVAGSWGILAFGDGFATLVGKHFRATEISWNRKKTYAGSFAFVIFGTIGAAIMLLWMLPELSALSVLSISSRAALIAAIVETLPFKINDNVGVAVASALAMHIII